MKTKLFLLTLFCALITGTSQAQFYSVKVNALALTTGTINAGVDIALSNHVSLDLSGYWNPIQTSKVQFRFAAIQPGIRYWFFESFAGHFIAWHISYARYKVGGKKYHYNGWLTGVGFSYGYTWPLAKRWNLTLEAGAGFYYTNDQKRQHNLSEYEDAYIYQNKRIVFAPSKCEVAISYLF